MEWWYGLPALFATLLALALTGHVALVKRDPRAATLWIVVLWFMPVLGALMYLLDRKSVV